jgi:hypothetical protein
MFSLWSHTVSKEQEANKGNIAAMRGLWNKEQETWVQQKFWT